MCKNRDLKLPLALRCGLSPPSWLLTLLMPVSMPSVLAWNKCFIWLGTCSSRLFVADTKWASQIFDLLALSCFIIYVFGVVWYFRVLRFEHNFCRCEPCLPVFREPGASAQLIHTCAVNPTHCSLCMLLIAPPEKLKLPWVWGEEFSKAFVSNKFLLLLQAIIAVCLLHSSRPFLELLQQGYY